ncbi:DUF4340 domain-containing protein [bacterium]|nr:DUF4340 domain-containing protein [bacterium]MCI0604612.1 DUF4340 domain-containing protein [bacterium]
MSYKTTIIIAVLLLLLGGYAYWFEYKGGQKKEEQKEKEKTLFEVKKEDVTQIQIEGIEPKPVILAPSGKDAWTLAQPLQARADQGTVDRIIAAFEKLKYKEIIEEQPKDLSSYELDKPKMTIKLNLKGNVQRAVSIGAKNPIDNVYYIKVNNDPRVYLAEGTVGDLSSTTLLDLRDKKLTDFLPEKVESVSTKTEQQDLQFKKENGVWKIVKPVQSPASDSEVTSLLSSLESLRATRFVDEPSSNLAEYGLDKPFASVELALEKGLRQKLDFGKAAEETYCRIEGNTSIAAVGDTLNATFDKKLEDWREKKVLAFNRFDVEEFRVKTGGKEYSFKKGESDKWNQLNPTKQEVAYDQIQGVLEKIESAEISKYGDQTGLTAAPSAEIFLTMKDWQEKMTKKHLSFGLVEQNLQQIKNDDYGTVVYAPDSFLKDLEKALKELKPQPPAPVEKKK